MTKPRIEGPHQGQPVIMAGAGFNEARAAMVMVHGRGATAHDILMLMHELQQPEFAYIAPQAAGHTWYPYSFMAPIQQNEPGLSSGFQALADVLVELTQSGFPPEKVMLLGFSQGGCLVLEFVARNARRYGGVVGLSAGLIGPEGTKRDCKGSLEDTEVFLGCSDIDPHVPKERVQESARVMEGLGADVIERLYPNMAHTINEDEIRTVQAMMQNLLAAI